MATLTNQNQWYDVASAGPYTSTIDGYNVTWTNVIQARWTSLSGTTYSVQYRCLVRKSSGNNVSNYSSYAGWSIGGTGANTVSGGTSEWIYYYDIGDNEIGITSGTINGTSGSVYGGVRLGYYGTTWGGTDLSGSITLPSPYSPPTGLSVSIAEKYTDGAKFNVSVSSYGTPSSASGRYIEGAILNQSTYGATYKYATASETLSSAITVTNSSGGGTLTIQPNTQYYYGAYASNTQANTNIVPGQFVTLAPTPTVSVGSVSGRDAVINYSTVADGGYYNKTIEYSTDGGTTWQTGATVTGGSAQSGSFTISNLSGGENTVLVRTSTTSGSDSPVSITIEIEKLTKFYGPVLRYGIVGGSTSSVNENMFSGFTAEGFMQAYEQKYGAMYGVPDHITVNHEAEDGSTTTGKCVWIYFDNGTRKFCTEVTASIVTDLNTWGMNFPGSGGSLTPDADTVALNSVYYDGYKSKEVKKLYGSVNGQTKRIIKMYGSVNGETKLVFTDES